MAGAMGLPLANDFNSLSEVRHKSRPSPTLENPKCLSHFFADKNSPPRCLTIRPRAVSPSLYHRHCPRADFQMPTLMPRQATLHKSGYGFDMEPSSITLAIMYLTNTA